MNSGSGAAQNDVDEEEEEEESVRTPEREKIPARSQSEVWLSQPGQGRSGEEAAAKALEAQGGGREGRKEECLEKFSSCAGVAQYVCVFLRP